MGMLVGKAFKEKLYPTADRGNRYKPFFPKNALIKKEVNMDFLP